jgi:prepilin-type processing-associated H-X9-DG protein
VVDGGTKEIFSHSSRFQNLVFLDYLTMSNELATPRILHCPSDTDGSEAESFTANFCNRNVSYFVGLIMPTNSPQTFSSGDDNFEISGVPVNPGLVDLSTNTPISWTTARHNRTGNILMSDGSVLGTTSSSLRSYWQQTGLATNRLAIP